MSVRMGAGRLRFVQESGFFRNLGEVFSCVGSEGLVGQIASFFEAGRFFVLLFGAQFALVLQRPRLVCRGARNRESLGLFPILLRALRCGSRGTAFLGLRSWYRTSLADRMCGGPRVLLCSGSAGTVGSAGALLPVGFSSARS